MKRKPLPVSPGQGAPDILALRSPRAAAFFGWIFDRSLSASFNAVRLDRSGAPVPVAAPRVIVFTNHPSWWDAVVYSYVSRHIFARPAFSPIDATMLKRYPFMARIGAFGVEQNSMAGARRFRSICRGILSHEEAILIVACQGRFADVRERPLRIEGGIAHLADLACGAIFIPLAIEYTFWNEKRPELLLRFGEVMAGDDLAALPMSERRRRLEAALEGAMTTLAARSSARDSSAFDRLISGSRGVNVIYDFWRRAKALVAGQTFEPQHGDGS